MLRLDATAHLATETARKMPQQFRLAQNYTNPFNPITTIEYEIPRATKVPLSVHNVRGKLVETLVNENKNAGVCSVQWNAAEFSSGICFYRLQAGDFNQTGKLILLRQCGD